MIGILAMFAASGGGINYKLTNLTELRVAATGDVVTGFRVRLTGQAESGDGNPTMVWGNIIAQEWQSPLDTPNAALHEVRAVEISRSDPNGDGVFTGAIGSWLTISTDRAWTLLQPAAVEINAEWVFDITIRQISSQATVASARITLQSRVV